MLLSSTTLAPGVKRGSNYQPQCLKLKEHKTGRPTATHTHTTVRARGHTRMFGVKDGVGDDHWHATIREKSVVFEGAE